MREASDLAVNEKRTECTGMAYLFPSSNRACKRTLLFADGIGPMHSPLAEGYGYSHRTNAG